MSFPLYRSRRRAAVVSQAHGRGKGRSRRPSPGICAQQEVGTPTASQAAVVEASCCDPEPKLRSVCAKISSRVNLLHVGGVGSAQVDRRS